MRSAGCARGRLTDDRSWCLDSWAGSVTGAASGSRSRRESRLQFLALSVRAISALNRIVGQILSWLALGIVLVCFTVVVQRYVFHTTQIWMQDLYVWLSGAMFTGV